LKLGLSYSQATRQNWLAVDICSQPVSAEQTADGTQRESDICGIYWCGGFIPCLCVCSYRTCVQAGLAWWVL